ncbi:MAG: DUF4375 domain-containing protein [Acidobacteria bacterium]|nr:DUF4375 domain-containing protein [Acidobacteriota bacterium]
MPDLEMLQPIAGRVIDQHDKTGLPGLSPRDQIFYLAWAYSALLANGGHPGFFYNSGADHYVETVAALRLLKLNGHAEWLEEAATLLFGPDVPPNMMERSEHLDDLDDDPVLAGCGKKPETAC